MPVQAGLARIVALSLCAWSAICLAQTLAGYSDLLAAGDSPDFPGLLRRNIPLYVPWALFSVVLHSLLARTRARLTRLWVFVAFLLAASLLFMVPYELYMILLGMLDQGGVTLEKFIERVHRKPAMYGFLDYILFIGCFAFLYALAVFQRSLGEQRRRQRIEAENLALRLEAEKNRLAALQGQLEPHFLFNALNALSSLVRADKRPLALAAIGQLSELLRYATDASNREWSSIAEEVAFVEDYVGLQRLRHGERLDFRVLGMDDDVKAIECPPLLLQPLVENALRHGLEACADGQCGIRVRLVRENTQLLVSVSNTMAPGAACNPGLGIGLENLRGRLALVHGDRANLTVQSSDARFEVIIRLPVELED